MSKFIAYHGTGIKFRRFNLKYSTQGIIWFSSDKQTILDGNAGAQGRGFIITAEVSIERPAGWDEYDKKGLGELRQAGYDGVVLKDSNESRFDCFVFSTKQIKIKKIEKV